MLLSSVAASKIPEQNRCKRAALSKLKNYRLPVSYSTSPTLTLQECMWSQWKRMGSSQLEIKSLLYPIMVHLSSSSFWRVFFMQNRTQTQMLPFFSLLLFSTICSTDPWAIMYSRIVMTGWLSLTFSYDYLKQGSSSKEGS